MEAITGIALAAPAGLNAYIPLLAVALAQRFGFLELRPPFQLLGEWWMIAIIAALLAVEIVADKVPAVDHANDAVQTFLRPAAGGILAVAASGNAEVQPWLFVLVGVLLAGSVHAVKVAAGGATGATLRYLVSQAFLSRGLTSFPWHTLLVNVLGSFLLGVLAVLFTERGSVSQSVAVLLGAGLLGGFTTFSAFSYETLVLLEGGRAWLGFANVVISCVLGLGAAWLGLVVGRAV